MNSTNKIRFAVVGLGHIGKRHAEMISKNSQTELAALVDIKPKEDLNIKYSIPCFSSLEKFFDAQIDVDVINIATPNGLHAKQAYQCLEAKKHVVIEKPLALTKADAEKIIYKALHAHKHVFVVMQNRYSPPSVWLKELIDSNKLGKIFLVQLNCYWNRDARYYIPQSWHGSKLLDGGTLYTQFSHFIDIMYWLFGDIENINSRMFNFNHSGLTEFEDSGFVTFDFVNGGAGTLNFSTSVWDQNLESSMTILAEYGSIKIGGQYMNEVNYCHIKDYNMPELPEGNPPNDYGAYKGSAANHHFIIENVVNVLNGKGTITTNALEGLKVVEIIERIYKSQNELR